ncbi:MAG: cobalt-precorrin 5A hydrolase [Candidatus Methanomethylophilaceae archaeon]
MNVRILAFTTAGCRLAIRISDVLKDDECTLYSKTSSDPVGLENVNCSLKNWMGSVFDISDAIVIVGATGIAVRMIAPFIKSKSTDPAIVSVDEKGRFVISLIAGHIGGSNKLTRRIASGIGAVPVITTATDINNIFSVDTYAAEHDIHIANLSVVKDVSSRLLDGRTVGLVSEFPICGPVPEGIALEHSGEVGILVSAAGKSSPFTRTLRLIPKCHVLGIGCRKGIPKEMISEIVEKVLSEEDISIDSIRTVASIDLKKEEPGLKEFSEMLTVPMVTFTSSELNSLPGSDYSSSEMVKNVTNVDCVCERAAVLASRNGHLVRKKTIGHGVTVAIARDDYVLDFTSDET